MGEMDEMVKVATLLHNLLAGQAEEAHQNYLMHAKKADCYERLAKAETEQAERYRVEAERIREQSAEWNPKGESWDGEKLQTI